MALRTVSSVIEALRCISFTIQVDDIFIQFNLDRWVAAIGPGDITLPGFRPGADPGFLMEYREGEGRQPRDGGARPKQRTCMYERSFRPNTHSLN